MGIFSAESRFLIVFGINPDSMENIPQVNFRKILNLV